MDRVSQNLSWAQDEVKVGNFSHRLAAGFIFDICSAAEVWPASLMSEPLVSV
jgi:hypothetical protein